MLFLGVFFLCVFFLGVFFFSVCVSSRCVFLLGVCVSSRCVCFFSVCVFFPVCVFSRCVFSSRCVFFLGVCVCFSRCFSLFSLCFPLFFLSCSWLFLVFPVFFGFPMFFWFFFVFPLLFLCFDCFLCYSLFFLVRQPSPLPGPPSPDRPPPDRPKFRPFFPTPTTMFSLSSLSWGSSRGILEVFLKRRDPQTCTFGRAPQKFHEKTSQEMKKENCGARVKKSAQFCASHPSDPNPSGPLLFLGFGPSPPKNEHTEETVLGFIFVFVPCFFCPVCIFHLSQRPFAFSSRFRFFILVRFSFRVKTARKTN